MRRERRTHYQKGQQERDQNRVSPNDEKGREFENEGNYEKGATPNPKENETPAKEKRKKKKWGGGGKGAEAHSTSSPGSSGGHYHILLTSPVTANNLSLYVIFDYRFRIVSLCVCTKCGTTQHTKLSQVLYGNFLGDVMIT